MWIAHWETENRSLRSPRRRREFARVLNNLRRNIEKTRHHLLQPLALQRDNVEFALLHVVEKPAVAHRLPETVPQYRNDLGPDAGRRHDRAADVAAAGIEP